MSTFDTIAPPPDLPPRHAGWQLLPDGALVRGGVAVLPCADQDARARRLDWWERWIAAHPVTGGAQARPTQQELDL